VELRQYLSVLRSRLWLILVTTALCAVVGFVVSNSEPTYVARSTIYVGSRGAETPQDLTADRLQALDRLVLTFSKMIDSETIADRAIEQLGMEDDEDAEDVVAHTSVRAEPFTQLLYVEVTDPNPATAQALANALTDEFVDAVQEYEPGDAAVEGDEGSVPRLPAYVFEKARLPTQAQASGQITTLILATALGFIVSCGLAFLLDYLDVSLRSAADVERRLELPVLGVIPAFGEQGLFGRPQDRPVRREGG
jgi:capsular polysaccharide biosynthesis protein